MARFISQDYRSRQPVFMTNMLNRLNLPLLQERRKQQRLAFFYKVVRGQFPAIDPNKYLKPIKNKRKIKPKLNPDYYTQNIVEIMARNNSQCYEIVLPKRAPVEKNQTPQTTPYTTSFFPKNGD